MLITSTTTSAFNSVLPIAGALVTAHGGSMSHAGIAARELGVPAVVGVPGAVELIPDGATVEVDALAGTVQVVADALDADGARVETSPGDGPRPASGVA